MIRAYTNGSCQGNPGNGGWAALIVPEKGEPQVLSGRDRRTISDRMEQMAVIKALEEVPPRAQVTVYSGSGYVIRTIQGHLRRRANLDLWAHLDELASSRKVKWELVAPQADHAENEFVNSLAEHEAGTQATRPLLEEFLRAHPAASPTALPHLVSWGTVTQTLRDSLPILLGLGLLLILVSVSLRATTTFQDLSGRVRGVVTGGSEEDLGQMLEKLKASPGMDEGIRQTLESLQARYPGEKGSDAVLRGSREQAATEGQLDNDRLNALLKMLRETGAQKGQLDAEQLRALLEQMRLSGANDATMETLLKGLEAKGSAEP
jgi:ribonuclease HI